MKIKCYAKLNLSLNISGVLPNGYHTVETVMQTVSLYDTVCVEPTDGKIEVVCEKIDGNNIANKAAEAFFRKSGIAGKGAFIQINKGIPAAAGLGGGSSDAAAVINALNLLFGAKLSKKSLIETAAEVGADVPFFIDGGTAAATGIGDRINRLPDFPHFYTVVVKADSKASTQEMYRAADAATSLPHPDINAVIDSLKKQDLGSATSKMANSFEPLWKNSHVPEVKQRLIENGALYAGLSGSGPSVFGIFDSSANLNIIAESFRKDGFFSETAESVASGHTVL